MKASFDEARRHLSNSFNDVADAIENITIDNDEERKFLYRRMNDLRAHIGGLNCMYDPNQSNDCNEIYVSLKQF